MSDAYPSDIPAGAAEEVIERYPSGARKTSRYIAGGQIVVARSFYESGRTELETPRRDGLRHGIEYQWDDAGRLRSAIPYRRGLEHGTSRQWGPDGALIGTYEMQDGTGVDLWHGIAADGSVYLSEVRHCRHGERHGIEWLINEDQRSVYREMTYRDGVEHGILREWEADGVLNPGRPAFFVLGTAVTLNEYQDRSADDPSLPPYRPADDRPQRCLCPTDAES
jgi:antitoxin component YwqK of YwqJK toxin-antitoxin module